MSERSADVSPARRHIIKRPRLTRLLDESNARIILLVAPAGYGKTTLAREWLEAPERQAAWYTATPAARDVAALALGMERALLHVAPTGLARVTARLRIMSELPPPEILAELAAEDLGGWPGDAWLVVDDYHCAMSSDSERFIGALSRTASLNLLITSRVRPSWITARTVLYGEVAELGPRLLAFDSDEARRVLEEHDYSPTSGLLALADGWPAVIGLAALGGRITLPEGALVAPLHEYLARELYEEASLPTRTALTRLAVSQQPTIHLMRHLVGQAASAAIDEAVKLGLCTVETDSAIDIHPLLLRFLRRKLRESEEGAAVIAAEACRFFLDRRDWDEAFAIAHGFGLDELTTDALGLALRGLLREGRLSTVEQWLKVAKATTNDPVLDVAEAEVAFLRAEYSRSGTFAGRASRRLPKEHGLSARARLRLGYAAYYQEDDAAAEKRFAEAHALAQTNDDIQDGLWGSFLVHLQRDTKAAAAVLQRFEQVGTPDDTQHYVRLAQGQLELATRVGDLDETLSKTAPVRHFLMEVADPVRRTGFLSALAAALRLAGRYREAIDVLDEELREAERYRLPFVLPHAYVARAAAQFGLRRFSGAQRDLARASATLASADAHNAANVACIHARLHLAKARTEEASLLMARVPRTPLSPGMLGEYLATRAIALACNGEHADARYAADRAEEVTTFPETVVLAAAARAIASVGQKESSDGHSDYVDCLIARVRETDNRDALIAAYRGYPGLLAAIAMRPSGRTLIERALPTDRDQTLAAAVGVPVRLPTLKRAEALTLREREVYELLAQGLRNREIAKILFISDVTVKAHVRQILRKLGVRSRIEAAILAEDRD